MKYFNLIVSLLSAASVAAAAPFNIVEQLVVPYTERLRDIIQSEDNPQKLSIVLQEQRQHLGHACPDPGLLADLIQLNRVESFKFCLTHMYGPDNC
jgi:hypothetical protein